MSKKKRILQKIESEVTTIPMWTEILLSGMLLLWVLHIILKQRPVLVDMKQLPREIEERILNSETRGQIATDIDALRDEIQIISLCRLIGRTKTVDDLERRVENLEKTYVEQVTIVQLERKIRDLKIFKRKTVEMAMPAIAKRLDELDEKMGKSNAAVMELLSNSI